MLVKLIFTLEGGQSGERRLVKRDQEGKYLRHRMPETINGRGGDR
jgi:hypothetical protein